MTYLSEEDSSLNHFGTKGMHWGVRKSQKNHAQRTAAGKAHVEKTLKKDGDRKILSTGSKVRLAGAAAAMTAGSLWLNKQFTGHYI